MFADVVTVHMCAAEQLFKLSAGVTPQGARAPHRMSGTLLYVRVLLLIDSHTAIPRWVLGRNSQRSPNTQPHRRACMAERMASLDNAMMTTFVAPYSCIIPPTLLRIPPPPKKSPDGNVGNLIY